MESLPTETVPEASPLTDAEKIRLKRLAKLQQNVGSNPAGTQSAVVQESSTTKVLPKKKPQPEIREPAEKKPVTTPPKPQPSVKSFEDWQNEVISKVLQITLDKSLAQKSPHQLIYLDSVVQELINENPGTSSFKLTKSILDNAIVARLSMNPDQMSDDVLLPQIPLFDYLLDCWKRAAEIKRNLVARSSKTLEQSVFNERIHVLDNLKSLIINYAELIIQYPEMFPQSRSFINLGPNQLVPKLTADVDAPERLPWDFIQEFVGRVDEEGFEEVFGPSLTGILAQMREKKISNGDYLRPLNTFLTLTEIKLFSSMLPKLRYWNPTGIAPRAFELMSLLGPFCRISAFPMDEPTIVENYFGNVQQLRQVDVDSAMLSLRIAVQGIQ
ncbi:12038_t:CDS:10, partial [Acaulospora morrowiae]